MQSECRVQQGGQNQGTRAALHGVAKREPCVYRTLLSWQNEPSCKPFVATAETARQLSSWADVQASRTKSESRRAVVGNGTLFDVDTSTCSDCGDLTAALTWGEWLACEDTRTSNESMVESKMMCRRRGNPQIGIEEEQTGNTRIN